MAELETPTALRKIMARDLPREVAAVPTGYEPPSERNRLHKLAEELDRSKLDEIKWRFKNLNYGEFKEFCEKTGSDIDKIWTWAEEP